MRFSSRSPVRDRQCHGLADALALCRGRPQGDTLRARMRAALLDARRCTGPCHRIGRRARVRFRGPSRGDCRRRADGGVSRRRLRPYLPGGKCRALPVDHRWRGRCRLRARLDVPAGAVCLSREEPPHSKPLCGNAHRRGGATFGHLLHRRRGARGRKRGSRRTWIDNIGVLPRGKSPDFARGGAHHRRRYVSRCPFQHIRMLEAGDLLG